MCYCAAAPSLPIQQDYDILYIFLMKLHCCCSGGQGPSFVVWFTRLAGQNYNTCTSLYIRYIALFIRLLRFPLHVFLPILHTPEFLKRRILFIKLFCYNLLILFTVGEHKNMYLEQYVMADWEIAEMLRHLLY